MSIGCTGCHLGLLMRAKLGRVQNARTGGGVNSALHHLYPQAFCTLSSFACIKKSRWWPFERNGF